MLFRSRIFGARFPFLTVTCSLPLLLFSFGCASRPSANANGVSPRQAGKAAETGLVETGVIEHSPAYHQAILSYRQKDYRGALGQINGLLKTPHLASDAQAFLQHQHDLCDAAASGRKILISIPSSAATRRPVRSAADADCGPRALLLVCQDLKIPARLDALRKAAETTADGTSMEGLAKAAHSVGLKADGVQMDRNALSNLSTPAVSWTDGNHYIAVLSIHHSLMDPVNGDTATVHDPNKQGEEETPLAGSTGLISRSGGMLLLLSRENRIASATVPTH